MYKITELREQANEARAAVVAAAEAVEEARSADYDGDPITDEHLEVLDYLLAVDSDARAALEAAEAREARIGKALDARIPDGDEPGFHINRNAAGSVDVEQRVAVGQADAAEERSFLLERAEQGVKAGWVADKQAEGIESLLGRGKGPDFDPARVRKLALTETNIYRDAFMKQLAGRPLTNDEALMMERAQAIGTDSAGGFGVPVLIDPTILVTTGTGFLPILDVANVKAITTDEWKGVSAPVVAWSGDAEAAEVSDDSITMAQPTVTTEKPQAYVPYSIEVGQDYPNFAGEIGGVIAAGYRTFLAGELADGAAGIVGVETGATTTVDVDTDNTFAVGDVRKVHAALPEMFRESATTAWFMHVDVEELISGFGTALGANSTIDLTESGISRLRGKRVLTSDFANGPSSTTLTDGQNILTIGDFQHFVVAQRVGMTVEPVPHVFGSNQRPTGQRGLYAYSRVGSNVVVANAFRRLKNITT